MDEFLGFECRIIDKKPVCSVYYEKAGKKKISSEDLVELVDDVLQFMKICERIDSFKK